MASSAGRPNERLIGRLPKVGIRPIIDGRWGGVRESLESVTLAMARAAADLIRAELRHPSGEPVESVVPDHCIGGVAESARVAELFEREGVAVSLSVTPCWCYGSETMDMNPLLPKAIWGFNGTERPGAVYLAATLAAHNQKGLPAFGIYGRDVQDAGDTAIPPDVREKILRFVRAGIAAATMRGKSYLAMGSVSMGIAGCMTDYNLFEEYLGMRVETVDMSEFVRRFELKLYDQDEFARALAWTKKNCPEGFDPNKPERQYSRAEKDAGWETCVKMALIARDLMIGNPKLAEMGYAEEAMGHNALAAGFQGQRQWTDHFPNGDFMEAILTSTFDWNGIRQPFMLATENDSLNAVSMLLGHLLTGGAQVFADVRTFWSPDAVKRVTGHTVSGDAASGFLHLINSGPAALDGTGQQEINGKPAMKPWWEVTEADTQKCLKSTTWHPGNREYFRGGGYSTRFRTRGGMPSTILRLNVVKGLGPVLQIAEGTTVDLPDNVHDIIDKRTDSTWPTTYFVPRTTGRGAFRDVYTVMNNWGSNHCSMCYGHVGADLLSLASILRIPVYMHNVGEDRIFRPSAWTAFGTDDPMGADFRACQTYGPIYK
jgi:L-fucose isomerase